MPVLDGYEASLQIRNLLEKTSFTFNNKVDILHSESLEIIAITGHIEPNYVQKAYEHGINEVLSKPIDILALANILLKHQMI